jgi:hypothetical protein
MSSFTRAVPENVVQLKEYLQQITKQKSHVKSVIVNMTTGHLEITLDGLAHFSGKPDVYLPLKRGKITDAKALIERMMSEVDQGFTPSDAETQQLFDMLDPTQK